MNIKNLEKDMNKFSSKKKAKIYQRFFKTGKGDYGEGDIFIGVTVPDQRKIAKKYFDLNLKYLSFLLKHKIHEYRLTGFIILMENYKKAEDREKFFNFLIKHIKYLNNWDLVDAIIPKTFGHYFYHYSKDRKLFFEYSKSNNLWLRRISILGTFYFIKKKDFDLALEISEILLNDKHDLIHKAVGWMLREIGKLDFEVEFKFLKKHYQNMPRTMLRYAIERFDESLRQDFLKGNI